MTLRWIVFVSIVALLALVGGRGAAQEVDVVADTEQLNPLADLGISDAKAFTSHPLFTPTRRPVKAEKVLLEAKPGEVEVSDPELTLLGVTVSPEGSVARIAVAGNTASLSVRQGESIEGWTISEISGSSARLQKGSETKVLTIFDRDGTSTQIGDAENPAAIVFEPDDTPDAAKEDKKVRVIQAK